MALGQNGSSSLSRNPSRTPVHQQDRSGPLFGAPGRPSVDTSAVFLLGLWFFLFLLELVGAKTEIPAKAAWILTLVVMIVSWRDRHALASAIFDRLRWVKTRHAWAFMALVTLTQVLAIFANQSALQGTLWDLTQYIQIVYNAAHYNLPVATFSGELFDYRFVHRSLSLWILKGLAGYVSASTVTLIWTAIWLFIPGFVCAAWGTRLARRFAGPLDAAWEYGEWRNRKALIQILCFLTWACNPVVLRQEVWPYTFHIMGMSLLALAYWFYDLERYLLWALCLVALAWEKEDFGIITASFGLWVAIKGFVRWIQNIRKSRTSLSRNEVLVPLVLGLLVCFWGGFSLVWFHKTSAKFITFGSRFGELGGSPGEVMANVFRRPDLVAERLFRPRALMYLFFFCFAGFLWIHDRWISALKSARYFLPVLLVLGGNLLASYEPMQELKDFYALPLAVGTTAVLILGTWRWRWLERHGLSPASLGGLALMSLGLLSWGHQSPMRTFKEMFGIAIERAPARGALAWVRAHPEVVVVCDDRLCSWLADRPRMLEARLWSEDHPFLKYWKGVPKVFVVYANGFSKDKIPRDVRWEYEDQTFKISAPWIEPFPTLIPPENEKDVGLRGPFPQPNSDRL